ncbi:nucleoside diphosphate kinase regulator [Alteromonadaceae bacterium BrNp21-10]|nr:nucleoside diphosphate kinase regulator [Alteromonadaceae bacterium BrNp21-10]
MEKQPEIMISTSDLKELEYQLEMSNLPDNLVEGLENELARANIVDAKDMPNDVVSIGSQVTFKLLETDRTFTKTLCFPADMAKYQESISIFAPIGSALLGLKTGQCINWPTQRGQQSVEIVQVIRK